MSQAQSPIQQYPIPSWFRRSWQYLVIRVFLVLSVASSLVSLYEHSMGTSLIIAGALLLASSSFHLYILMQTLPVRRGSYLKVLRQTADRDDLKEVYGYPVLFRTAELQAVWPVVVARVLLEEGEANGRMRDQALCLAVEFFLEARESEIALRARLQPLVNAYYNAGGTAEDLERIFAHEGGYHTLSRLSATLIALSDTRG